MHGNTASGFLSGIDSCGRGVPDKGESAVVQGKEHPSRDESRQDPPGSFVVAARMDFFKNRNSNRNKNSDHGLTKSSGLVQEAQSKTIHRNHAILGGGKVETSQEIIIAKR
jgi:hypothetical protein